MPSLDVFKADSFNMMSLTTAINKLPYKPARLGEMKLFKKDGIPTTVVMVEERQGKLMLVPSNPRGVFNNVYGNVARKTRAFPVINLPLSAKVYADDVQNIRAFGSETEMETVSGMTNDKLSVLRQSLEYTHEWHRLGAIKGVLLDADGTTTLFNWFTEFDITQETDTLNFTTDAGSAVKKLASRIIRDIQDGLGMTTYDHIHVMCGSTLFDNIDSC